MAWHNCALCGTMARVARCPGCDAWLCKSVCGQRFEGTCGDERCAPPSGGAFEFSHVVALFSPDFGVFAGPDTQALDAAVELLRDHFGDAPPEAMAVVKWADGEVGLTDAVVLPKWAKGYEQLCAAGPLPVDWYHPCTGGVKPEPVSPAQAVGIARARESAPVTGGCRPATGPPCAIAPAQVLPPLKTVLFD